MDRDISNAGRDSVTTITQHAAGMFCWSQLGTKDPEGAKKFYAQLFGWTFDDAMIDGQGFTLVKKAGKTIGGLYGLMKDQRDRGVEPNWEGYIAVEDADQIVAQVKKNGGQILMGPIDIADHGRMAVCQDPTTATFSLWQAKRQIGAELVNEIDTMCWNELITDDAAKAGAFYRKLFGWTEEKMPLPERAYTVFKNNGAQAAGMMQATPEMRLTHPYWLTYFAVADCDKGVAKAQQLGGRTMLKPTDIPNIGRFSVLTDPQGAYFAIITMEKRA